MKQYDLVVIGGGPGGYSAAIRALQKGLKTVLVESGQLGGTCLNRGCVPTKTFLEDTLMVMAVRTSSFLKGDMKVSLKRILERKNRVVTGAIAGLEGVLKGNGVEIAHGQASFLDSKTLRLIGTGEENGEISADKIIIATGAKADYTGLVPDGIDVLSTEDALALDSVPSSVAVVGAGSRGVEFASIYSNLGAKVTLVEQQKRILPKEHPWLSRRYKRILVDRGIMVSTQAKAVSAGPADGGGAVLSIQVNEKREELKTKKIILAVSRRPCFDDLHPEAAGLSLQEGRLHFGPGMETGVNGIYVVGDAAGPPYLAHKAIAQGMAAVDHILGLTLDGRPLHMPNCIYGDPEIGSVGMTESQARKAGRKVKTGEFYFTGNGRAGTMGKTEGLIVIISDEETEEVLGVHILGPRATEVIALGVTAMQNGLKLKDLQKTVLPHLTFSESYFEAALAASNEAIHMLMEKEREEDEES